MPDPQLGDVIPFPPSSFAWGIRLPSFISANRPCLFLSAAPHWRPELITEGGAMVLGSGICWVSSVRRELRLRDGVWWGWGEPKEGYLKSLRLFCWGGNWGTKGWCSLPRMVHQDARGVRRAVMFKTIPQTSPFSFPTSSLGHFPVSPGLNEPIAFPPVPGASCNFPKMLHPSFYILHSASCPTWQHLTETGLKHHLFTSLFCISPAAPKTNWIFHYRGRLWSFCYFSCNFHVCLLLFLMRLKAADKRLVAFAQRVTEELLELEWGMRRFERYWAQMMELSTGRL